MVAEEVGRDEGGPVAPERQHEVSLAHVVLRRIVAHDGGQVNAPRGEPLRYPVHLHHVRVVPLA